MTADTSPTGRRGKQPSYSCSFCGKSQDQVQRLIAGPRGAYICDECVRVAAQVLGEESGQDERLSFDPPSYLVPYGLVARLWAASAAVAETVMMMDGWKPQGLDPARLMRPPVARAKLPEQLREVVEAARRLGKYYDPAGDIVE